MIAMPNEGVIRGAGLKPAAAPAPKTSADEERRRGIHCWREARPASIAAALRPRSGRGAGLAAAGAEAAEATAALRAETARGEAAG